MVNAYERIPKLLNRCLLEVEPVLIPVATFGSERAERVGASEAGGGAEVRKAGVEQNFISQAPDVHLTC